MAAFPIVELIDGASNACELAQIEAVQRGLLTHSNHVPSDGVPKGKIAGDCD